MIPTPPPLNERDNPIVLSTARRDLAMIAAMLIANTDNHVGKEVAHLYDHDSAVHEAWGIMQAANNYDPNNASYLGRDL